jgi:radical SAM superfamily enzyme with C-terminal helix-hairpin-helix motif
MSPNVRYAAGALVCGGVKDVRYHTIDDVRRNPLLVRTFSKCDLVIAVGGVAVPGKYIGGMPASPGEIERIMHQVSAIKIIGGPLAKFGFGAVGGKKAKFVDEAVFDFVVRGDVEAVIPDLLKEGAEKVDLEKRVSRRKIGKFAVRGAFIVAQHQDFPNTLCEIETYRGCAWRKCSFCIEPQYGTPDFRDEKDIIAEVQALYNAGIKHFRLGAQPDLFAYRTVDDKPNPDALRRLYSGIRNVAPDLKVLHMDNANPAFIAAHPDEGAEIAKIIVRYHTSGDVAALGGESADPEVIKKNALNASPDDVFEAVKILNRIGAARGSGGLPELLPGLNFVFGLRGETRRTYELNYEFLKSVLEAGLMVRRINLRQVAPMKGTGMFSTGTKIMRRHRNVFRLYKEKIRKEIDHEMLRRVLPAGTVLRDIRTEMQEGKITFGRQIASYPVLVGFPAELPLGKFYDAAICSHGFRSVTGVPYPLDVNKAPISLLSTLPGIGEKRARRIVMCRPFKDKREFIECLDDRDIASSVVRLLDFGAH